MSKVTRVTLHPFYYSMCSKCPLLARMQVANIDTTCKQQAQQPAFHNIQGVPENGYPVLFLG